VALAEGDNERVTAERFVAGWRFAGNVAKTVKATAVALAKILARAGSLELSASRIKTDSWNPTADVVDQWARENAAALVKDVDETTRKQLSAFLTSELRQGHSADVVAANLRKHFAEFPNWRADLIAREETKRYYNAGTLFAAQAAGSKQVQALDAQGTGPTDAECERRNGRLFPIADAWVESSREHVRGTLSWRILPPDVQLSFTRESKIENGVAARVDQAERVIYLTDGLDPATEGRYLERAVEWLIASA
jgi:hypothetical protein